MNGTDLRATDNKQVEVFDHIYSTELPSVLVPKLQISIYKLLIRRESEMTMVSSTFANGILSPCHHSLRNVATMKPGAPEPQEKRHVKSLNFVKRCLIKSDCGKEPFYLRTRRTTR